jgi:hydroxyacid-oxoacid transhydrogenase
MANETAFNMATSNIRFGPGATAEIGMDLRDMGAKHVLVVTDPKVAKLESVSVALQSLDDERVPYTVFDRVRSEPTDGSMKEAIDFANAHPCDALVGIGGGSAIDTAKVVNLYTSCPADFLDYVNAPVGKALPVTKPLKPLIAVPTTSGTGSEVTSVAVVDIEDQHIKTGIAHARLKPTLGILDPNNTKTQPPLVAASTGLDVLTHAAESYTAIPYTDRPKPDRPSLRPGYQGANPISDAWSLEAMRLLARYLRRAVDDPTDDEARGMMMIAASLAGIGFGNAGVHLAHAMSYPISGMVRDYVPDGYDDDHPIVPHGMSVVLNAPAVFRFTAPANPQRHLEAALALGADVTGAEPEDAGTILADRIIDFMRDLNIPNGLAAVGFTGDDIPALVKGSVPQQRLTKLAARPNDEKDLARLFEDAMTYW